MLTNDKLDVILGKEKKTKKQLICVIFLRLEAQPSSQMQNSQIFLLKEKE